MPTRQGGKSVKNLRNLRSADTLADHYRTVRINAVNLKDRLRNIDTDCANLTHGRLSSMWFVSTQPPYGTSMPQSGRPPPHHSRSIRAVSPAGSFSLRPESGRLLCEENIGLFEPVKTINIPANATHQFQNKEQATDANVSPMLTCRARRVFQGSRRSRRNTDNTAAARWGGSSGIHSEGQSSRSEIPNRAACTTCEFN